MRADEFNIWVKRLAAQEAEAQETLNSHVEILTTSWARREKLELNWVASARGIESGQSVVNQVCSRLSETLISGRFEGGNYAAYTASIYTYAREILDDQFAQFFNLIRNKNDKAWQKVYERLYIYAAKWLSDRSIEGDAARDIYQESVLTFFEKVSGRELRFETSREFKSYFFRILELKTIENSRKRMLQKRRYPDTEWNQLIGAGSTERSETDDRYFFIEKIMQKSISGDELYILKHYYFNEEKLSDIAETLRISDGNCRQKKLQALRKIAAVYHQMGLNSLEKEIDKTEE
jgi:RNA polymerase sigma factor (sigma-70 family)